MKRLIIFLMIVSIIAMGCAKEESLWLTCPAGTTVNPEAGTCCPAGTAVNFEDGSCCTDADLNGECDEQTAPIGKQEAVEKLVPEAKFSCKFFSVVPYFECIDAQKVNGNLYLNLETTKNHPGMHKLKKIVFNDISGCNWEGDLEMQFGGRASIPIICANPAASKFTLTFEWIDFEINSKTATITALGEIKPYDNSLTAKIIGIFD